MSIGTDLKNLRQVVMETIAEANMILATIDMFFILPILIFVHLNLFK